MESGRGIQFRDSTACSILAVDAACIAESLQKQKYFIRLVGVTAGPHIRERKVSK